MLVYLSMHSGRHPQQTATAVGGTHPTGMHSCFIYDFACEKKIKNTFSYMFNFIHQKQSSIVQKK